MLLCVHVKDTDIYMYPFYIFCLEVDKTSVWVTWDRVFRNKFHQFQTKLVPHKYTVFENKSNLPPYHFTIHELYVFKTHTTKKYSSVCMCVGECLFSLFMSPGSIYKTFTGTVLFKDMLSEISGSLSARQSKSCNLDKPRPKSSPAIHSGQTSMTVTQSDKWELWEDFFTLNPLPSSEILPRTPEQREAKLDHQSGGGRGGSKAFWENQASQMYDGSQVPWWASQQCNTWRRTYRTHFIL